MKFKIWLAAASAALILPSLAASAGEAPSALVLQPSGTVEQSRDGVAWKPVARNRYVFPGEFLRTGPDGSAKIADEAAGTARTLASGSKISFSKDGVSVESGTLSPPSPLGGDLSAGLANRFAESQRYTTVRRSSSAKEEGAKLRLARSASLSKSWPELVWESAGPDSSYVLRIDGTETKVPPTKEPVVRVKVPAMAAGQHAYAVDVVQSGKVVSSSEKDGGLTWLSDADDAALAAAAAKAKSAPGADDLAAAGVLDSAGVFVGAMDLYRRHFAEDPDDDGMRPLLIRVYHELGLSAEQKKEAATYNERFASK